MRPERAGLPLSEVNDMLRVATPATRVLFGAVLIMCGIAAALAQITVIPGQGSQLRPNAASPIAPKGTSRGMPGSFLKLRWSQTLNSPLSSQPATHFLICVYEPAVQTCATTGMRWMLAASSIARVPVVSGTVTTGYRYSYQLPVAVTSAELDRRLEWSVGACASNAESSCTFATTPIWMSTKNLTATNISNFSTETALKVSGEIENRGSTSSGGFTSAIVVAVAFLDSSNQCETDVNAVPADYALLKTGAEVNLDWLPTYQMDGKTLIDASSVEDIVALYAGPGLDQRVSTEIHTSNLNPNRTAEVLRPASSNSETTAYAIRLMADSGGDVFEFEDEDNLHGECYVVYTE
jgi:hypothetical protein